jgi:hypothetical protein
MSRALTRTEQDVLAAVLVAREHGYVPRASEVAVLRRLDRYGLVQCGAHLGGSRDRVWLANTATVAQSVVVD